MDVPWFTFSTTRVDIIFDLNKLVLTDCLNFVVFHESPLINLFTLVVWVWWYGRRRGRAPYMVDMFRKKHSNFFVKLDQK